MAQKAAGSAQGDAERAQRAADRAENFAPPEDGAVVSVNGMGGVVTLTAECDTKSRNVLCINTALSIWSNPTVTCTGQKPALGSSQDNMGNLPA